MGRRSRKGRRRRRRRRRGRRRRRRRGEEEEEGGKEGKGEYREVAETPQKIEGVYIYKVKINNATLLTMHQFILSKTYASLI